MGGHWWFDEAAVWAKENGRSPHEFTQDRITALAKTHTVEHPAFQPYVNLDEIEAELAAEPSWMRFYLNRISDETLEDRRRKCDPRGGVGGRTIQHPDEEQFGEADHRPAPDHGGQGGIRRRGITSY